jgi:hypothetical protein
VALSDVVAKVLGFLRARESGRWQCEATIKSVIGYPPTPFATKMEGVPYLRNEGPAGRGM